MNTTAFCQDDTRREGVRAKSDLNGLDYVEVDNDQLTLRVYFLGKAPALLKKGGTQYVCVKGGQRIRDIKVVDIDIVRQSDPELDDSMIVRVDQPGDFSTYTLRLVGLGNMIDPFYDHLDFSFKVNCPSDLDCAAPDTCPPPELNEPDINYLAKDYASFRQLILDRLALLLPDWQERHVPDLGVALVEVLAYAGDHLSYYQDAVATEAYLDTARQRISVRRHARLVDYVLHEGCNARAWLCISTESEKTALQPRDVYFITGLGNATPLGHPIAAGELRSVPPQAYEVFEAVGDKPIDLYAAHREMHFYTWGERECCLPRGTTRATLRAKEITAHLSLKRGDVLIFEEVLGPKTGRAADADPTHRHAVRLIKVTPGVDTLYDPPRPIVEIEWAAEDALPFPLCLSTMSDADHGCVFHEDISVARGNVVLVDHGLTIEPYEELGAVPIGTSTAECECAGHVSDVHLLAAPFRPHLAKTPLTYRQPLPADGVPMGAVASAASWMQQDERLAVPQVFTTSILPVPAAAYHVIAWNQLQHQPDLVDELRAAGFDPERYPTGIPLSPVLYAVYEKATAKHENPAKGPDYDLSELKPQDRPGQALRALIDDFKARFVCWRPQVDLLGSGPDDRNFVVEIDNDGTGWLRFGDDECGQRPEAGSMFFVAYRMGNGTRGNVGAEAIKHVVFRYRDSGADLTIRNPLPAHGGVDPEPVAEAKLFAPSAFRKVLKRAITGDDYAQLAQREFKTKVQRAAAVLDWTGSWYEASVAIDPKESEATPRSLLGQIDHRLQRYRRIGHDLTVAAAHYIPIELELTVCVLPHLLRGHVKAALLDVFSNRLLSGGRRGAFHPDQLTFGDAVTLSRIVATAQAVPGVESVRVTKLNRLFELPNRELENGVLPIGSLEVAQLDNDPNFPEHGKLTLIVQGGR